MAMVLPVPRFTIDMLDDLPDDGSRYELLEGSLLVTPAPSWDHQVIATRLAVLLANGLGKTAHVVAVGAIQRGESTQLQPDILVVPSSYDMGAHWRLIDEWWLAVEVMSPSSRVYDREVKRAAYIALGVQEYWLVDLQTRSVEVWHPSQTSGYVVTKTLRWRPLSLGTEIVLNLDEVFGAP